MKEIPLDKFNLQIGGGKSSHSLNNFILLGDARHSLPDGRRCWAFLLTLFVTLALTSCSGDEPVVPGGGPTRGATADSTQQGGIVLTVDDEWAAIRHVNFDEPGDTLTFTIPDATEGVPTGSIKDAL